MPFITRTDFFLTADCRYSSKGNSYDRRIAVGCQNGISVSGTDRKIGALYKGATVKSALALRGSVAQNRRSEARSAVDKWYAGLGL